MLRFHGDNLAKVLMAAEPHHIVDILFHFIEPCSRKAFAHGDIDSHIQFFQQYGFLVPVGTEEYEAVEAT